MGNRHFGKFHKRKNWFIGIYEIEATEETLLKENEIKFQAIRSSGAGGQHVNKVSSAIRAIHTKTGMQVLVMDSRSQHQNKKIAIKRLQEKVDKYNNEQLKVLDSKSMGKASQFRKRKSYPCIYRKRF